MNMTRAILEGIHEVELQVTPEFQKPGKPTGQKLMDVIGDYVDMEVIVIDDLSGEPTGYNPVGFPGNTHKYPIIGSELFGEIEARIKESGTHWIWNGSEKRFYMYPGADMSVPVFWNRVYNLASWFLEQVVGSGVGEEPREDNG